MAAGSAPSSKGLLFSCIKRRQRSADHAPVGVLLQHVRMLQLAQQPHHVALVQATSAAKAGRRLVALCLDGLGIAPLAEVDPAGENVFVRNPYSFSTLAIVPQMPSTTTSASPGACC